MNLDSTNVDPTPVAPATGEPTQDQGSGPETPQQPPQASPLDSAQQHDYEAGARELSRANFSKEQIARMDENEVIGWYNASRTRRADQTRIFQENQELKRQVEELRTVQETPSGQKQGGSLDLSDLGEDLSPETVSKLQAILNPLVQSQAEIAEQAGRTYLDGRRRTLAVENPKLNEANTWMNVIEEASRQLQIVPDRDEALARAVAIVAPRGAAPALPTPDPSKNSGQPSVPSRQGDSPVASHREKMRNAARQVLRKNGHAI